MTPFTAHVPEGKKARSTVASLASHGRQWLGQKALGYTVITAQPYIVSTNRMETILKISKWITKLTACAALALAAPLHADVGQMDRQGQISNTYSTPSREKLRSEMDATEQATRSHGGTDMSSSPESPDGARGDAGARHSQHTRDEVREESGESSRMNRDHPGGNLSRPKKE